MKFKQGPISKEQLVENLVNAKKVMGKVDSGNYEKGNISQQNIVSDNDVNIEQPLSAESFQSNTPNINEEKIKNSNLPENIKQAMIKSANQISLDDTLNMNVFKEAKKLMNESGSNKTKPTKQAIPPQQPTIQLSNNTIEQLIPIIENIIRKTLDEKLNQLLAAKDTATIDENLVLKVGDSIFQGKITKVKRAK